MGASAPRAAPRETFVREPFRKKTSARKPYRATPFGGRRLQTPTARNRLPARQPLCCLSPAYLTEGDPRPGPPGDRARGSPSRCGGYTSMAAKGGGGRRSCEGHSGLRASPGPLRPGGAAGRAGWAGGAVRGGTSGAGHVGGRGRSRGKGRSWTRAKSADGGVGTGWGWGQAHGCGSSLPYASRPPGWTLGAWVPRVKATAPPLWPVLRLRIVEWDSAAPPVTHTGAPGGGASFRPAQSTSASSKALCCRSRSLARRSEPPWCSAFVPRSPRPVPCCCFLTRC